MQILNVNSNELGLCEITRESTVFAGASVNWADDQYCRIFTQATDWLGCEWLTLTVGDYICS